jgi:hypothetical protein|tara:strand:+ start:486 stop:614 length:129 start_codon:yes stop_codon:yes gene_type:complete
MAKIIIEIDTNNLDDLKLTQMVEKLVYLLDNLIDDRELEDEG